MKYIPNDCNVQDQERKAILWRNWRNNEKIHVGLAEVGLRGDFGGGGTDTNYGAEFEAVE